ncbi:MAG: J domain-containing protein, partial [Rhodospirillales bacterium]|nr:J domain-containing protein [Rhodospirillales bacterium]
MKNLYAVLGVPRAATQNDIKKAFRKLAREIHPDRDPGNPWAAEEFRAVAQAYEVLADPDRRSRYDRGEIDEAGKPRGRTGAGRASAQRRRRGWPFGRERADDSTSKQRSLKVDGVNVTYTLIVTLFEALRGAAKEVAMTDGKRLKVTIPAGARDGQVLRLKRQGMPGIGAGSDGDALIEITVAPDPVFRLEGDDVHVDVPITLQEAVLGGRIEVPTVDGAVNMTVPAPSNTGSVMRLRNKGLPKNPGGRGDQYVHLNVVLPPDSNTELTE